MYGARTLITRIIARIILITDVLQQFSYVIGRCVARFLITLITLITIIMLAARITLVTDVLQEHLCSHKLYSRVVLELKRPGNQKFIILFLKKL
jgi:hypothetical protein